MNETLVLSEFLSELRYEDLPPEVVEMAKLCILDTVGVGLTATRWPWSAMAADQACEDGGAEEAVVWGRPVRVPAQLAALANATAAHGIEMDDRLPIVQQHPGSMAVPAALAAAEKGHESGQTLITAVVAGYELGLRVGHAVFFKTHGLHFAGHKGVWCGVGAAAKALGLDRQQTQDAYGLAGSMACGITEFSEDTRGTMVKRLHGGLAAHHGVLAASLARRGFTGPGTVLEGRYGYCHVFVGEGEIRMEELVRDLGGRFRILERETKPYASWGGGHNAIDAVGEIQKNHEIDPNKIAKVRIGGSNFLLDRHGITQPQSVMAAQYSLPFLTALALCRGPEALMDPYGVWTTETLDDPQILGITAKTELYPDPELEALREAKHHYGGAKVSVVMTNGEEYEVFVEHSKGTVENPMTPEELRTKFRAVAQPILPDGLTEQVLDRIDHLEQIEDVRELSDLLAGSKAAPVLT